MLALVHFLSFLCYLFMIAFVLYKNPKALLNRICALLLLCFVIWSFGIIFLSNGALPKNTVRFIIYATSIGWFSFAGFALLFILGFTKKEKLLKSKLTYVLIFLPVLVFYYKEWMGLLQADFIKQPYGWTYVWAENAWPPIFYVYYSVVMLSGLFTTFIFSRGTGRKRERKQANAILVTTFISLVLGSVSNVILQEMHIYRFPPLADVFCLIFVGGFIYAITRYGFMAINPATAAENILATMDDVLLLIDTDNKIVNANQAASDLLGYEKKELIGKAVDGIFSQGEYTKRLDELKQKVIIKDYDALYHTKSGSTIPVSLFMSLLKDKYNELAGIVCIARDMRDIKRLMEKEKDLAAATAAAEVEKKRSAELEKAYTELSSAQAQLVQSAKMAGLGQLSAGVAHEINNPLGGILGYAQFILSKIERPDFTLDSFKTCKEYLGHIERESQRCKKIVENLLNFSRKSPDVFQPVDLKVTMENTLSIIRHSLETKNIKVTTDYDGAVPLIQGNANQLQQVFTNMIINAQHAMQQGGELNIYVKPAQDGDRKMVHAIFKDTGCGIPKENLERIFEPFFTTKGGDWKSVGLGLSICYQIIEQHKGKIIVDSEVGKGTTFTIALPVEQ
ncbi:MAG: ATP-binding protein [Candidatus Omnitrophica bacterium]|nr:ATP-binding protein [Candidatus Omnitrophota bacterium]